MFWAELPNHTADFAGENVHDQIILGVHPKINQNTPQKKTPLDVQKCAMRRVPICFGPNIIREAGGWCCAFVNCLN